MSRASVYCGMAFQFLLRHRLCRSGCPVTDFLAATTTTASSSRLIYTFNGFMFVALASIENGFLFILFPSFGFLLWPMALVVISFPSLIDKWNFLNFTISLFFAFISCILSFFCSFVHSFIRSFVLSRLASDVVALSADGWRLSTGRMNLSVFHLIWFGCNCLAFHTNRMRRQICLSVCLSVFSIFLFCEGHIVIDTIADGVDPVDRIDHIDHVDRVSSPPID